MENDFIWRSEEYCTMICTKYTANERISYSLRQKWRDNFLLKCKCQPSCMKEKRILIVLGPVVAGETAS